MKQSWTRWYWLVWLIIAGLAFLIPEGVALLDGDPTTEPLTNWLVRAGLATPAALFGLWVYFHFKDRRE